MRLIRQLQIKDYFVFNPSVTVSNNVIPSFVRSNWVPTPDLISRTTKKTTDALYDVMYDITSHNYSFDHPFNHCIIKSGNKPNLTHDEWNAIKSLKDNPQIVIRKADKSNVFVVLNREDYINEGLRQLSDYNFYSPIRSCIKPIEKLTKLLDSAKSFKVIPEKLYNFLKPPPRIKPRTFYTLPKIHKPPSKWINGSPPGRPIVSDIGSPDYNINRYLDFKLKQVSHHLSFIVKDSFTFLQKLKTFLSSQPLVSNMTLITCDVTSLYTNMKNKRSLDIVHKLFSKHFSNQREVTFLYNLLRHSLSQHFYFLWKELHPN